MDGSSSAPYRRGQGLSSDAGPYIGDEIAAARAHGGDTQAAETMVRLLSTDHLRDQMAALAWIKRQAFVRPGQIAAMGNSFGGIETVLGAELGGYCAAIDAAGGAESWDLAPSLRNLMLSAVKHSGWPKAAIDPCGVLALKNQRSPRPTVRNGPFHPYSACTRPILDLRVSSLLLSRHRRFCVNGECRAAV